MSFTYLDETPCYAIKMGQRNKECWFGFNYRCAPPQPTRPGFEAFGFDVDGLADWPFNEDDTAQNGSPIALLLQYEGKSMLLGADAHPSVLVVAIGLLTGNTEPKVDLIKVPHHGRKNNISKALLNVVKCRIAVF